MIPTATGRTVLDAWKSGVAVLDRASGHEVSNLITVIEDPSVEEQGWNARFSSISVGGDDRLSVVADVLFPVDDRQVGEPRDQLYTRHARLLIRARRSRKLKSQWGSTYFERLLSLDGSDNQIERAIHALTNWGRKHAAIVGHLSSPRIDRPRTMGSPCLQYFEVLWNADDTLDLVAVYRNHDFLNKTLGNFVGLSRLLRFIAKESRMEVGQVICHSVHAYANQIGPLRRLVAR